MINPPDNLAGTNGAPITVRALNDGKVLLDGQGVRQAISLSTGNHWLVIEGINAKEAFGAESITAIGGGASFNIIRRVVAWNSATTSTSFPINIKGGNFGGTKNLVEDSAFFGLGRKACGTLSSGGLNTTWRRVWCRWEGLNAPGLTETAPKMALTMAYQATSPTPTATQVENVLATWTGERGCLTGTGSCDSTYGLITWDGGLNMQDNKQKVLGSFAYVKPGASYLPGGSPSTPWVFGAVGWHDWAEGTTVKDVVSYMAGYSAKAFDLRNNSSGKTLASANRIIGIGGASYSIGADWSGNNRVSAATVGALSVNPYNGFGGTGPLCYQYIDGVLRTDKPLWPWPMDQRIKDALALAGSSPLAGDGTVTGEVESLLGPIPDQCRQ